MENLHSFLSYLLATCILSLLTACKKDATPVPQVTPNSGILELTLIHQVDSTLLEFDTLKYYNAAGNHYKISKLEYFISNIELQSPSGNVLKSTPIYINAASAGGIRILLTDIPIRVYTGIKLLVGLDSIQNLTGSLPNTPENNAMYWPDFMGGGYHFMKLEGHFQDSLNMSGFAVHLGRNPNVVNTHANLNFTTNSETTKLSLRMNVNEWFTSPHNYNLAVDGNHTMGSMMAMKKISENGFNVFTLNTP